MFKAMVVKELRETRAIALLGLATYGLLVAAMVDRSSRFDLNPFVLLRSSWQQYYVPFVEDEFLAHFCWVSAAIAIALGLRQTVGESMRGTYPLLFHRPATRRWLIGMKLLVGTVIYLICGAVPILAYAFWAATPGTHASPFEWSMTVPSWVAWFAMTLFYLGAFLIGIRPGRWYRSRLLPLAAAAAVVFITFLMAEAGNVGPLWRLLVLVAADVWMVATIFFIARTRDYS